MLRVLALYGASPRLTWFMYAMLFLAYGACVVIAVFITILPKRLSFLNQTWTSLIVGPDNIRYQYDLHVCYMDNVPYIFGALFIPSVRHISY